MRRWQEILAARKQTQPEGTDEQSIPRRIESIDQLPGNLPPGLQLRIQYCIETQNIEMINWYLNEYRRNVLAPSDKYRLQRLASRDLNAAIQPSVGATPPENMAMRILEQYEAVNYSMGDIQIDPIPSDEKFYFHPFTQTDIQKALEKIRSTAAGPD
ncbi:hypothetical protein ADUPG1_002304, partial [Aduncisulcus paluster]